MEIGERIIALREAKGWTTNRLANQCGLSQSFLRSVELGEKGISVENLALICGALGEFYNLPGAEPLTGEEVSFRWGNGVLFD